MNACLDAVNACATRAFGLFASPLSAAPPWLALVAASALTAVLLLTCFRLSSSPGRVRRSRDRTLARIMELGLFPDDPLVNLSAIWRSLAANARYLSHLLPALIVSTPIILLILVQVHGWLDLRPLVPGDLALVTIRLAPDAPVATTDVKLSASPALAIDSAGIRAQRPNEVSWRLRVVTALAPAWVEFAVRDQHLRHPICVGPQLQSKSTRRVSAGLGTQLANPDQPSLPPASLIASITVQYPTYAYHLAGRSWSWLLIFCATSLAIAWPLRRQFGVEV